VCKILPSLTHQLTKMTTRWAKLVGTVAEVVARGFLRSQGESRSHIEKLPTLLTEANRSAGRSAIRRQNPKARSLPELDLPGACQECGVVLNHPSREYCDECLPERREAAVANFTSAGPVALAKRRAEGTDPAHSKEARRKQGLRAAQNVRANGDWEKENLSGGLDLDFKRQILPGIQAVPLSRIMEATGLSQRCCSLILRGLKVPHRCHWQALQAVWTNPSEELG
jgi:hypothetical protein